MQTLFRTQLRSFLWMLGLLMPGRILSRPSAILRTILMNTSFKSTHQPTCFPRATAALESHECYARTRRTWTRTSINSQRSVRALRKPRQAYGTVFSSRFSAVARKEWAGEWIHVGDEDEQASALTRLRYHRRVKAGGSDVNQSFLCHTTLRTCSIARKPTQSGLALLSKILQRCTANTG